MWYMFPRKSTTMWRAGDGPGHCSVYGARTVSCTRPGIRVVENRYLFCSIDCACPRWMIGGMSSPSSRTL